MPLYKAWQLLSSPFGEAKEDNNVEKWSGTIFVMKFWSVTHARNDGRKHWTSDIGDYANSILDSWPFSSKSLKAKNE